MLQISLELALDDPSYADMALKFFEHFVWIASAMIHIGGKGEMWDEEDGFFYDVLRTPDGRDRSSSRSGRWWGCCRCARRRSSARR